MEECPMCGGDGVVLEQEFDELGEPYIASFACACTFGYDEE